MSLDVTPDQLRLDLVAFADTVLRLNEKGQPWSLSRHQRRVLARFLRRDPMGRLLFRLLLWGEIKKSGKSFLAALAVLWWGFVTPSTEIPIVANDLEQAMGRVFKTTAALVHHNRVLQDYVTVRAEELIFSNRTIATAIAGDWRGAAGSRHSFYSVDEPWAITQERAERLIEEITPPITEPNAWGLWTTTAGIVGESVMLERYYQRGLAGTRVDDELELYEADELAMFWSHIGRQPWQLGSEGERYYAEQRRSLRPSTYLRLHENRWVTAESTFLTPELWDACVDAEHHPELPDPDLAVTVGWDIGVKNDYTAVDVVRRGPDEGWLTLVTHRLWKPTAAEPIDLEDVEAYLRTLAQQFRVQAIYVDPYQAHRSITTLREADLPIVEFPQTVANTTRMGQTLYELLKGQNLRLYPDAELRQQALNTIAVESTRGFRIAKEKASKKIDGIVALSLACVACLDQPQYVPVALWGGGP